MKNTFEIKNGLKVWVSGSVVIESVRHIVRAGFIKCNHVLNGKSWNTTKELYRCSECFKDDIEPIIPKQKHANVVQLSLFD